MFVNKLDKNKYERKYWKENKEKLSFNKRMNLFKCLGEPICKRCGFSDIRALQIDHINGGGSKERKNREKSFLMTVRQNPNKFQILCANCNWIKRVENREATGQPKKLLLDY